MNLRYGLEILAKNTSQNPLFLSHLIKAISARFSLADFRGHAEKQQVYGLFVFVYQRQSNQTFLYINHPLFKDFTNFTRAVNIQDFR